MFNTESPCLGIAKLRSVLKYHGFSSRGNKDQIVIKVSLLRSGKRKLIHDEDSQAVIALISEIQKLVSHQVCLKEIYVQPKKRKYTSYTKSSISSKDPRKAASAVEKEIDACLPVPLGTTISNIIDILQPLKDDLMSTTNENAILPSKKVLVVEDESDEDYFEIGVRVYIRWCAENIGDAGWAPAWYAATVQDSCIENDWIKVEYTSEPDQVYKIQVRLYLSKGHLKLKKKVL